MENFLKGLEILRKYGLSNKLAAAHDVIWVGCEIPPEKMDKEDAERLENLGGWYFEEEYDCWATFT